MRSYDIDNLFRFKSWNDLDTELLIRFHKPLNIVENVFIDKYCIDYHIS